MKITIILGLIFMCSNLFGQSYFYWYKGEKISLKLIEYKKFVLYETEFEDQAISHFEKNSWKIIKKDKDNSVNTLDSYKDKKETPYWAFIEREGDEFTDSLTLQLSEDMLYVSPFFLTEKGDEAGLSHLFMVYLGMYQIL